MGLHPSSTSCISLLRVDVHTYPGGLRFRILVRDLVEVLPGWPLEWQMPVIEDEGVDVRFLELCYTA
jgi:hypothetical protein